VGHAHPRQLPGLRPRLAGRRGPRWQHGPGPGTADRHAPRRHALLPPRQRPERQHPRPARAEPGVHRRGLPAHRHEGPPGEGRLHARHGAQVAGRPRGQRGGGQPGRSAARPPATSWCARRPIPPGPARWAPSTTARTA
jgi:hypothetical protein